MYEREIKRESAYKPISFGNIKIQRLTIYLMDVAYEPTTY
jgi:hypothetical protein